MQLGESACSFVFSCLHDFTSNSHSNVLLQAVRETVFHHLDNLLAI